MLVPSFESATLLGSCSFLTLSGNFHGFNGHTLRYTSYHSFSLIPLQNCCFGFEYSYPKKLQPTNCCSSRKTLLSKTKKCHKFLHLPKIARQEKWTILNCSTFSSIKDSCSSDQNSFGETMSHKVAYDGPANKGCSFLLLCSVLWNISRGKYGSQNFPYKFILHKSGPNCIFKKYVNSLKQ